MKKNVRNYACMLCLAAFALMAMGSGSTDSGDKKDIVTADGGAVSGSENAGQAADKETDAITIEKQVLVDQEGIVITATEYTSDSIWGDGIKLLLENNSDKTVRVGCSALIVNNYMINDLFSSEIAPGKKANETMNLSSSQLKAAGIDTVGQVEMYFHIYDSETYDKILDTDCITVKTSAFDRMDTTPNDTGTELYNQDGIRIVGKAVDEDSFWGTAILLYCENTSGKNVGIQVEEMSINGFMMNPVFSTTVYDGKMAFDDITIFSSDLKDNGITAIEEVELKFHIFEADTYKTIVDSDPITFSAK